MMINRNTNKNVRLSSARSAREIKLLEKNLFNSLLYNKQLLNIFKNESSYVLPKPNYLTERNYSIKFIKSPLLKYEKYTKEFKIPYYYDKVNKPTLLKIRSIDSAKKLIKKSNTFLPDIANTFLDENYNKKMKYIFKSNNKMTQSINKNFSNFNSCHTCENQENKYYYKDLLKLFPKMEPVKISVNSPIKKKKKNFEEMIESLDKVNIDYFVDFNLQKRVADALHKDFNTMDKNFEVYYKQFYKSIPNYINFIYDINMLPHIQNKFLFTKPIDDKSILSGKITCRNFLQKEVAISMNRNIIKHILLKKKEEQEKLDKLRRMRNKKDKQDSILQQEVENREKEVFDVEMKDYFMRIRDYKNLDIAEQKYKYIVYNKFKK